MNEKIQQLVKQANREIGEKLGQPGVYLDFGPAKYFAELIVEECAGLVDNVIMEDGTQRSDFIRKYFGVEL